MDEFEPHKAVIPIFIGSRNTQGSEVTALIGTGFFVRLGGHLHVVTAKHVFDDNPISDEEHYAYMFKEGDRVGIWRIPKVVASTEVDVAWFEPEQFSNAFALPFSDEPTPLNRDVMCYEYSSTRVERKTAGGHHLTVDPFSHKGNIMISYDTNPPSFVNAPCFVVSFPAFF